MLRRSNEPAPTRVLDQRIAISTPAEWILVLVLILQVESSLFLQSSTDRFVRIFDPLAFEVWSLAGELSVRCNGTEKSGAFAFFKLGLLRHQ